MPLQFPPRRGGLRSPSSAPESRDKIVQQTDTDASSSRLSAVTTGYLTDPYAALLSPSSSSGLRKLPLINRGTYVRTTALDLLVSRFLLSSPQRKKQIISLGAGSDTRFFRFRERYPGVKVVYHELDFGEVMRGKVGAVKREERLRRWLAGDGDGDGDGDADEVKVDEEKGALISEGYCIHPVDLRTLKPGAELLERMDPGLPTLFLSECCLIYLEPEEADGIVKWILEKFGKQDVGLVLYEPIGGGDAFGKVMVQNLASRGIVLKTLKKYSSLERQRERLKVLGFRHGQGAADVDFIHNHWVNEEERARIGRLEMLDEVEEWQLLARHYCIAWGWKGGEGESLMNLWTEGLGLQKDEG